MVTVHISSLEHNTRLSQDLVITRLALRGFADYLVAPLLELLNGLANTIKIILPKPSPSPFLRI